MKKKVGLIGFGTIGKYIFEKLSEDGVEFAFVYDIYEPHSDIPLVRTLEEMEKACLEGVDLVIETAIPQVVVEAAPIILKYTDLLVFSTTAFSDELFTGEMEKKCTIYNHHIYIPHGAILGLDGIYDGREILESIFITTTKKPENLGRNDLEKIVLYEGPTRKACKLYPRNVNVHAGIAMAGLGFDETQSKIISDPNAPGNTHEIAIKSKGCNFNIKIVSNPISGVTGAYTPVSAYSAVCKVLFKPSLVII